MSVARATANYSFPGVTHISEKSSRCCSQLRKVRLGQPDACFSKLNVLQRVPAVRRVRAKSTMAKQHEVLLSISDQQEYAIRKLFCENNWEYTNLLDIPSESNKTKRRKRSNTSPPNPPAQPDNAPVPSPPSPPPPADPAQLEEEECPQCFQTPCVTVRGHYWLGEGQPAHPDNHGIRRIKYKSYWKTINNLGGWLDQRYIEKKVAAGGAVHDKRELMPNCVVNQLRQLYPNPANMQYMGHMWI